MGPLNVPQIATDAEVRALRALTAGHIRWAGAPEIMEATGDDRRSTLSALTELARRELVTCTGRGRSKRWCATTLGVQTVKAIDASAPGAEAAAS